MERFSAAEAVFKDLLAQIREGRLAVGERLPSEAALAQGYGVSRSVIREALRSCAALGLTVSRTGKGTFVVSQRVAEDLALGAYSARDLHEARPHIEVPAAGLAARRRTEEDVRFLQDVVAAMAAEDDPQAWVELDASFHAAVARISHNRVFEKVIADIREALFHQSETLNVVAARQKRSDEEHLRIFHAIRDGAADEAEAAMQDHLAAVRGALGAITGE
ncbi:FadR/GntR family transcriptional regulator [Kocuria rosea]|uniref:FadR/GntR family transcriptional regulator n=1 Tax=Kocuria rosea TaxID=1275 RepID=UPI000D6484EB|nr:FadR/GntR family transcriptional regulator [Kocuria rosea]PWF85881.1 GntR family transcriptional regulator [Kocuria rosea]STX02123.1 L-lactate utilization operon repressor [Kocuria rosea]